MPRFYRWRHLRFPGCLPILVRSPCSPDPGGIAPPCHGGGTIAAYQMFKAVGFPTISTFGAQSHGSRTRSLRFAVGVAPRPRKTRYRPAGYAFAGWIFHPLDGSSKFQDVIGSSILLDRPLPGAMNGHLFLFVAKNRRSAKVLLYDGTGLCVFASRLQRGLFVTPWERGDKGPAQMTQSEMALFLEGSQAV